MIVFLLPCDTSGQAMHLKDRKIERYLAHSLYQTIPVILYNVTKIFYNEIIFYTAY